MLQISDPQIPIHWPITYTISKNNLCHKNHKRARHEEGNSREKHKNPTQFLARRLSSSSCESCAKILSTQGDNFCVIPRPAKNTLENY